MKVLVTSTPGAGHVHPLVPVARALRDAGHDVTWATASVACPQVEQFGFECFPAGLAADERLRRLFELRPAVLTAPPRERRKGLYPMFSVIAAPEMLGALEPIMDRVQPDLVVHEPLEWAAAPLAAARQVPHVTVGFGGLISDALLALDVDDRAALWDSVGLAPPDAGGLYDHLYLHPFPPSFGAVPEGRNIERVRPMNFDGAVADTAPPWVERLGADRPFVYVTFGTEAALLAPLAVIVEAAAELDADIVMTVSRRVEPDTLGPLPANLRVEQYVPQRLLLQRASALVSHAGSGAVLGGAAFGLPQLSLPIAADQFENADTATGAGVGLTLDPDEVEVDTVRAAITRLLSDAFVASAGRVAAEIAEMPGPDAYVDRLTDLGSTS